MDMFKDYNLILKEREKRKNFIFEKGLIDFRRQNRIESKLSKDEYDMLLFMKPFNRFYQNSEFYDLFESIIIEQKLKLILKNINQIENENDSKEGKKITTIEDIEEQLETEKANNKGRKQGKANSPHESKDNNSNSNEDNLLFDRIERYMQYNKLIKEKKEEEIFDEDEFKFMKELPLARSTFYDIKLKIKEAISLYENKGNHKNENLKKSFEKIIQKYDLERQTHLDIFEFYYKKYSKLRNKKEAKVRKKKTNKNGEITR
jgi:transcriptional adapter 2-alpha